MSSGNDLRAALNGTTTAGDENNNLVFYGILAGIILLAVVAFVVIGLSKDQTKTDFAETPVDVRQPAPIEARMNAASLSDYDRQRIEQMKIYNQTLADIQMCKRLRGERKKFEEIKAGYEKRNAEAVASWKRPSSKILQKLENGDANSMDIAMWQASGAAQRDIMNELSDTIAMTSSFERLDEAQCMKLSGDVRMRKFDIEARPQS